MNRAITNALTKADIGTDNRPKCPCGEPTTNETHRCGFCIKCLREYRAAEGAFPHQPIPEDLPPQDRAERARQQWHALQEERRKHLSDAAQDERPRDRWARDMDRNSLRFLDDQIAHIEIVIAQADEECRLDWARKSELTAAAE